MPRKPSVPSYRHHKPSGQAVVTLGGHDHYLGKHDTPESRAAYRRLLAEWLAGGRGEVVERAADLTVSECLAAYFSFAQAYYVKNGEPTSQLDRVRRSLAPARDLYGAAAARSFGPTALKAVRAHMVAQKWCRKVVNQRVGCLVRAFKWAVSEELVPASVYQGLRAVEGLRAGRTEAPERPPVPPAPEAHVEAALAHARAAVAAMVRLQLLTAMRPGEVCALRARDVDRAGPSGCWVYRPGSHKTEHKGHARLVLIGPRAQELLRPWLRLACPCCGSVGRPAELGWRECLCGPCADAAEERGACGPWPAATAPGDYYLFSPAESMRAFRAEQRAARKSKVQPSQADRAKKAPKKAPRQRYATDSYNQSIGRACAKAGVPAWHAHQLRHNAATRIVEQFGWEVARIVLGHRDLGATRIYAEDALRKAADAVREAG